MGDRGNIIISDRWSEDAEPTGVVLYTHWGGSSIASVARLALARRQRWNDAAYLARIVFDEMTKGSHGGSTGYGIAVWPNLPDNEHRLVILDTFTQRVVERYAEPRPSIRVEPGEGKSFVEFVGGLAIPEPPKAVMS